MSFPTFRTSALLATGLLAAGGLMAAGAAQASDWRMYGWNVAHTSAPDISMGVGAAQLRNLQRQQVRIAGTVDASVIYLQGASVKGARHNVFFMTTTYGKTLAIDATSGALLWVFTPPSYDSLKGTYRITNSTPVANPDGKVIYAAAPDGMIRALSVADGKMLWATAITRLPEREKIASPLGFFHGHVIATTDGYIGDQPPYQGHVAVLDGQNGRLLHVWNALCSNRTGLLDPASCPESDAGIWGRAGAVINPATGNIFVATGNAPWDGRTYWGDAVIELSPDASRMLGNYTPGNTQELNEDDGDIGSTSPVLTGGPWIVQGGKDGYLRVLEWSKMQGTAAHRGGAASKVQTPGGARLFTAPAVWRHGGKTWLFVADNDGTEAWTLAAGTLHSEWKNDNAGTSPVVADGMAFIYDPKGGLYIYDAVTGHELDKLACGPGHWNSPIVVDGILALPEGNANEHATSGVFDIWRLPKR